MNSFILKMCLWVAAHTWGVTFRRMHEGRLLPYLDRYYLLDRFGRWARSWLPLNPYLHRIRMGDERVLHNHPWSWALSIVLVRGYYEWRGVLGTDGVMRTILKLHKPGSINWIPRSRLHYLRLRPGIGDCWTLVISGPQWGRTWGFLVGNKLKDSHAYKSTRMGRECVRPPPNSMG